MFVVGFVVFCSEGLRCLVMIDWCKKKGLVCVGFEGFLLLCCVFVEVMV